MTATTTIGQPYQPLAEDNSGVTEAQKNVASGFVTTACHGNDEAEWAMLADGRMRVYIVGADTIIKRIAYIAPDGKMTEDS